MMPLRLDPTGCGHSRPASRVLLTFGEAIDWPKGNSAATNAPVRSLGCSRTSDLIKRLVRVNTVSPGAVATERYRDAAGVDDTGDEDYTRSAKTETAPGSARTPRDLADAVVVLASGARSFIPGNDLLAIGGMVRMYTRSNGWLVR